MKKADALTVWRGMEENEPILPHMAVIPYKATGSRYGACGIRIDGNPEFINSVLSHLKELLDGENIVTRLELARNKVDGSKLGKHFENADDEAEVCYIRLHQRGGEAVAMGAMFHTDDELQATLRFQERLAL